ncbi:NADPH--cytochrome P450 reductase isoform X2 [Rosa chinensis]|uniref:NADPH--cytochrome P450 reductase isoform X2 n=1 Tax=Rosa chinensis TaxID=74649 RepID=UPI001AD94D15|nr:NADPH--cytochrome P450 reductase isoform X2 [Rosa chinensis]
MAVVIATTSIELIIGFLVVLWRRSSDKTSQVVKQLAVPLKEEEDEFEVASGKTRVTIFSGTQTGTAEGFAKDWWIWYGSHKQSKGPVRRGNNILTRFEGTGCKASFEGGPSSRSWTASG